MPGSRWPGWAARYRGAAPSCPPGQGSGGCSWGKEGISLQQGALPFPEPIPVASGLPAHRSGCLGRTGRPSVSPGCRCLPSHPTRPGASEAPVPWSPRPGPAGRAGRRQGAAGTRPAPCSATLCPGAARPPAPNLPHQTVTSSPGPEPAQRGREGKVPEIDATWRPEAANGVPGWDGNQLLGAVSRKILFMADGAEMKPLSWLHGPSPSPMPSVTGLLSPSFLSSPLAVLASATLGSYHAGVSQGTQRARSSKLQTSAPRGRRLRPYGLVPHAIPPPPFCQLLSGGLLERLRSSWLHPKMASAASWFPWPAMCPHRPAGASARSGRCERWRGAPCH